MALLFLLAAGSVQATSEARRDVRIKGHSLSKDDQVWAQAELVPVEPPRVRSVLCVTGLQPGVRVPPGLYEIEINVSVINSK
jgi:hypothetical protein